MKVKLVCSPDRYDEIENLLLKKGFEICEDADFTFKEEKTTNQFIIGEMENESVLLKPSDIIYIESQGSLITAHLKEKSYHLNGKLYEYDEKYSNFGLIRVNKSFIVNVNQIKSISSTFNSKFILKMKNGDSVDVTRSYYYIFKEYVGL